MAKRYGRWETLKSLDEGGQSHVYLVHDPDHDDQGIFALKRLKKGSRLPLFEQEVKATRSIDHPNIVRIIEFDLCAEQPYYVAEYCEKRSLVDVGAEAFKGNIGATVQLLLPI